MTAPTTRSRATTSRATTSRATTPPTGGLRDRERCDTLVLAALVTADRDGYAVLHHLQEGARGTPQPSAQQVFASLHRLARNRLVRRSPDDARGYRLTGTGRRVLAARTRCADAYAAALHDLQG